MFDGMGESALRNTQKNHLLTKVKRDGFIPKSEVRLAMSSDEEADINGDDSPVGGREIFEAGVGEDAVAVAEGGEGDVA